MTLPDPAPAKPDDALDEVERLIGTYQCRCGSGGPMSCDDDCPGDTTPGHVREAIRLLCGEVRLLRAALAALTKGQPHAR